MTVSELRYQQGKKRNAHSYKADSVLLLNSEYELKRKLNMEENKNLLKQLGLNEPEGIAAVS